MPDNVVVNPQPQGQQPGAGATPQPATLGNFEAKMRAKNEAARQQPAPGQRSQQVVQGTGPIGDRARAAEAQAKSTPPGDQAAADPAGQANAQTEQQDPPAGTEEQQEAGAEGDEGGAPEASDAELIEKAKKWDSSPELPMEFLDKMIEVTGKNPDGSKFSKSVPVKEMKDGYMRQYDYQRQYQQMQVRHQDLDARESRIQQHFEKVNTPEAFLETYEDMGYGEVFEQAAIIHAKRIQQERRLVEAAGIAAMQELGIDDPNHHDVQRAMASAEQRLKSARKLEIEHRRLQAEKNGLAQTRQVEDNSRQQQQRVEQLKSQLAQLTPVAMKAHGVVDSGPNREDFLRHLKYVVDNSEDGQVDMNSCMKAAQSLSEELEMRGQKSKTGSRAQPLPPQRLSGAGSTRAAAVAERTAGKPPSEFAKQYFGRSM